MNQYQAVIRASYLEVYEGEADSDEAFIELIQSGYIGPSDTQCVDWDVKKVKEKTP
jgi:hypothetical protein